MALADFSHANMFHDNFLGGGDYFSPSLFSLMDDNNMNMEVEGMESLMNCNPTLSQLPTFSDSSNSTSTGEFEVGSMSSPTHGELMMLSFENVGNFPYTNSNSSMLSFDHLQAYPLIAGMLEQNQINSNVLDWNSVGIPMDMACLGKDQSNWMYSEGDSPCKSERSVGGTRKRSYMDVNDHAQTYKRQCLGAQSSPNKPTVAKDPQSLAAKNRRERISERLKTLQDLVPNGTKVDLVTMLEKAISYVKFLQLQVKVLATDEFWPANGGRTPEIGEVKEAIDAILSSHKDTTLNSSKQQYHC